MYPSSSPIPIGVGDQSRTATHGHTNVVWRVTYMSDVDIDIDISYADTPQKEACECNIESNRITFLTELSCTLLAKNQAVELRMQSLEGK